MKLRRTLVLPPAGRHRAFASHLAYRVETTPSGLQCIEGWSARPAAAGLAASLARSCPLHLVLDFNAIEDLEPPEGAPLGPDACLFFWFPEEIRVANSALLVSPEDGLDPLPLLEAALDHDAVSCVYSRLPKNELLAVLRPLAGAFCRPSSLRDQLSAASSDFVDGSFEGVEAMLVEQPEPGRWAIFTRGEVGKELAQPGFLPATDAPAG